jgi:hypothetical protein
MDLDLSKYKDMFGKPMQGLHKYRVFDIAVVDVALTILAAWLISHYGGYSFIYTLGFLFILGIILHRLFSVRTAIDKLIFPDN